MSVPSVKTTATRAPSREERWATEAARSIFPDLFKRLADHFYEERKRTLKHNVESTLKYLSDEKSSLP